MFLLDCQEKNSSPSIRFKLPCTQVIITIVKRNINGKMITDKALWEVVKTLPELHFISTASGTEIRVATTQKPTLQSQP